MAAKNEDTLEQTVYAAISVEGTEWSEIVSAVEAKHTIKNWMTVRRVIQKLVNSGKIRRTDSVHIEKYIRIEKV
jgi:hypothetical protein